MIHPEAHAPVRDIPDYEGEDHATVYRSLDTLVVPAMTIALDGVREFRKALDEGEAGILAYRFRTIDLSGINLDEVSYLLATLGLDPYPEETDWVAVGRRLEATRQYGGYDELRKLHALLAGAGAPESGAPLPGACAWDGGEGPSGPGCPHCRAEQDNAGDSDEGGPVFGEAELRRADAYRDGEGSGLD